MQQLKPLQHDDHCVACGVELPAGTRAYWRETDHDGVVRCVECQAGQTERQAEPAHDRRAMDPPSGPEPSGPAESPWERAHRLGREGERRTAEVLDKVRGIEAFHDRQVPGSRANIDHIAVGEAGVFVIDSKNYTGRVEVRKRGGRRRTDLQLYVNDRRQTRPVEGVTRQTEVVATALGDELAHVPVRGVLCFVGSGSNELTQPHDVNLVTVLPLAALAEFVSAGRRFDGEIAAIANRLRCRLRPQFKGRRR